MKLIFADEPLVLVLPIVLLVIEEAFMVVTLFVFVDVSTLAVSGLLAVLIAFVMVPATLVEIDLVV